MSRRRRFPAGAVLPFLLLIGAGAQAQQLCSETLARERLARLQEVLMRPESLAAMDAAKVDFAADQDFDNERDARVLAAAALYFKIEGHLDAGAVEEACLYLSQGSGLIDEVMAGQ